jgi:two-component system, LuxR family, response regulator FixJ
MSSTPAKLIVYVVDDDPGVLGSLRFLLETDGFDVETFKNGSALLNAVESREADCFVIDYNL